MNGLLCAGTLTCNGRKCVKQWKTKVFGGPSSDVPHQMNENEFLECYNFLLQV